MRRASVQTLDYDLIAGSMLVRTTVVVVVAILRKVRSGSMIFRIQAHFFPCRGT